VPPVLWAVFSPDGTRVVTRTENAEAASKVLLWELPSGKRVGEPLAGSEGQVYFSPDGARLLTLLGDVKARGAAAHLWDARTGKAAGKPFPADALIQHAEFTPYGKAVLTLQLDKEGGALPQRWDAK